MLDFLKNLFNSIFGNKNSQTPTPQNQLEKEPTNSVNPPSTEPKNQPEVIEPVVTEPEVTEPKITEPKIETEITSTPDTETSDVSSADPSPPDPTKSVNTSPPDEGNPASIINPEVEADIKVAETPDKLLISVERFDQGVEDTLGKLYINGKFSCYTLENPTSGPLIPAGEYPILLDTNNGRHATYRFRFRDIHKGMLTPEVPNFPNIFIHIGNRAEDTEGSILVGEQIAQYDHENAREVWYSDKAYVKLYSEVITQMDAGKEIVIDIK